MFLRNAMTIQDQNDNISITWDFFPYTHLSQYNQPSSVFFLSISVHTYLRITFLPLFSFSLSLYTPDLV